ncbi:hypothetical protein CDD83_10844 [Cordyceps sp. RAO-2017]|nr:hypothetical protein CDD83_10844 [Cordyceps sp. RAO-2017]
MPTNLLTRLGRLLSPPGALPAVAPAPIAAPANLQRCTVAAGCFWGVEHLFRRRFPPGSGVVDIQVGYMGGATASPSYEAVCGGATGHAEAATVVFDPARVSYARLLAFFFRMHDPTTEGRQGPDVGPQYRSAIFVYSDEQEATARRVRDLANGDGWWKGGVRTEVVRAGDWWPAEEYHQRYLTRREGGYECPSHFVRDFAPLEMEEEAGP